MIHANPPFSGQIADIRQGLGALPLSLWTVSTVSTCPFPATGA